MDGTAPRTSPHFFRPTAAAAATTSPFGNGCEGKCATCPHRASCGFRTPPHACPGPEAQDAGTNDACAGCPNRQMCASRAAAAADPDLPLIRRRLAQVRHTVVVLSGKGGVGKSTFSAQLAFALAAKKKPQQKDAAAAAAADEDEEEEEGMWQVGLMDVDICGPSIPTMLGIEQESIHATGTGMTPAVVSDNLAAVSVGFLLGDESDAVVWRGPRKNGLIKQFLRDVDWGERGLDWLVVDTPPGTSDEHLSVVQYLKDSADGAVIVTTPQDVALADVRKEIRFCQKVGLRVLGVVENMSGFVCPCCHREQMLFPRTSGGAEAMCAEMGVPFLGRIPIDPAIARACDDGRPYFAEHPDSPATKAFLTLFDGVLAAIGASSS